MKSRALQEVFDSICSTVIHGSQGAGWPGSIKEPVYHTKTASLSWECFSDCHGNHQDAQIQLAGNLPLAVAMPVPGKQNGVHLDTRETKCDQKCGLMPRHRKAGFVTFCQTGINREVRYEKCRILPSTCVNLSPRCVTLSMQFAFPNETSLCQNCLLCFSGQRKDCLGANILCCRSSQIKINMCRENINNPSPLSKHHAVCRCLCGGASVLDSGSCPERGYFS